MIQLRDKALDDDGLVTAAREFRAAADAHGALFVLNDRPDLVAACGADGVHVGQDDGSPADARAAVGPDAIVGRSTHAPEQADAAEADPDVDYLAVGPVHATPTKPGRPAAGLDYVAYAAAHARKPWFAIGGLDAGNVAEVVERGATRIVVVRAITEAADPEAGGARAARRAGGGRGQAQPQGPHRSAGAAPAGDAAAARRPADGMARGYARCARARRRGARRSSSRSRPASARSRSRSPRSWRALLAVANLVLYLAGWEVAGEDPKLGGALALLRGILLAAAVGMWLRALLGRARLRGAARRSPIVYAGLSLLFAVELRRRSLLVGRR